MNVNILIKLFRQSSATLILARDCEFFKDINDFFKLLVGYLQASLLYKSDVTFSDLIVHLIPVKVVLCWNYRWLIPQVERCSSNFWHWFISKFHCTIWVVCGQLRRHNRLLCGRCCSCLFFFGISFCAGGLVGFFRWRTDRCCGGFRLAFLLLLVLFLAILGVIC